MRRQRFSFISTLFLLIIAVGCSKSDNASSGQPAKIVLTGSSTVAPLMAEIGKRFEAQNPGIRVDVQAGGSSRGIADARQGLADIGMISRAMTDQERDLQGIVIARDGICIIVHKDNTVQALDDQQVVSIYTGKITNWKDVGGSDAPITIVNKAEGRSTLELFLHYYKLKNADIKASVVIGDNQQGIKTVAGNAHSIGYVSIGSAEHDASNGVPIKLLPMVGVPASTENVKNGKFPLSRVLTLLTKSTPQGAVQKFIEFARSPQMHDVIREQNFVPME